MLPREGYVLWPSYFNKNISKRLGRRVSRNLAVNNPTAKEILKAAKNLGFDGHIENGAYPRLWWLREGKVIVKAEGLNKNVLIKKIAEELVKMRSQLNKGPVA